MKTSFIVEASIFTNRKTANQSLWLKLANGDKLFINKQIAQSGIDAALASSNVNLTLHEGCEIEYEQVDVKKGDTYLDNKGVVRKDAGTYSSDQTLSVNITIDYTEAKEKYQILQANAEAYAVKQEARQARMDAAKLAMRNAGKPAVVVEPVIDLAGN